MELSINQFPNEIFESIFQNLNYMDLVIASKVCRKWRDNAITERNHRKGPYSSYAQFNSTDFDSIRQSPIKPFVGFFFLMSEPNDVSFDAEETIRNKLPTNCKTIMLDTYLMNFNARDVTLTSNTLSNVATPAVVFALLPEISNVEINMVVVQNNEISEYTEMIETAFRQNHESIMCIMLFYNAVCSSVGEKIADIAYSRFHNNKRVSLCGGMIYDEILITDNETNLYNLTDCVAVLITGSIQTWSIVLGVEIMKLAKEKLQIFKEQVQLHKYTVGFAFFTDEQTTSYNNFRNDLLTMFKQLFPQVSLIGCCYQKIFGRDTVTYERKFLQPHSEQWHKLAFESIAFTILTYG